MRVRTMVTRGATLAVFLVVGALYLLRPDLGTIAGVVGTGVVAAVAIWNPKRDLAPWQALTILLGLPGALLYRSNYESAAEQLFGSVLVGVNNPLAALGILAAGTSLLFSVLSLAPARAQRATS